MLKWGLQQQAVEIVGMAMVSRNSHKQSPALALAFSRCFTHSEASLISRVRPYSSSPSLHLVVFEGNRAFVRMRSKPRCRGPGTKSYQFLCVAALLSAPRGKLSLCSDLALLSSYTEIGICLGKCCATDCVACLLSPHAELGVFSPHAELAEFVCVILHCK